MSTHERIGYIDIAKAIGIISVIIGHMWWYQPEMNLMYSFHIDRKSTRLNSSHSAKSRMPSSA